MYCWRPVQLHFAPYHGLGQRLHASAPNRHIVHHAPSAHDRYLVAQGQHFFEFVGDQNHGRALRTQLAQHGKQLLRFLRR